MKVFYENFFATAWLVFGIVFFVLAMIDACNGQNDRSIACIGVSMACHARCEVKVLESKIKKEAFKAD